MKLAEATYLAKLSQPLFYNIVFNFMQVGSLDITYYWKLKYKHKEVLLESIYLY